MRLSEIYTSVQGEGPGVSQMTQFVRFAGCNLRCPLWPCDTQHAIDPEKYRDEWTTMKVDALFNGINDPLVIEPWPRRVTFTGGEPFLQPKEELQKLYNWLYNKYYTIEVFTNGTLEFPTWVMAPIVTVIMDWKLPGSGEDPNNKIRIDKNLARLQVKDAVKFVIADRDDYRRARQIYYEYFQPTDTWRPIACRAQVYYGAAWGKIETKELVQWVMEDQLDWKLNVQVHNYIWPRDERGR